MQLTDRFGPIPASVVLDGSGNGTVTFQPNGKNARITNLYVRVSTSTSQAVCRIYKGQVGDSYLINSTNSGSTGAAANGTIDVQDGETLYVVWSGGDAGATAIATFVGNTIPFEQVGSSRLDWQDPIAAGDGSLVYPALKSPNFSAGVSGWRITRDGDVEFNDATVRGTLLVTGPNSSYIEVTTALSGPIMRFQPPMTAPFASYEWGSINATETDDGTQLVIESPYPTGQTSSVIALKSDGTMAIERALVSVKPTLYADPFISGLEEAIIVRGNIFRWPAGSTATAPAFRYPYGQSQTETISFAASTSVVQAITFSPAFEASEPLPKVFVNINSTAGATRYWNARAANITRTGFDLWMYTTDAARVAEAWTNVSVQWIALVAF